MPQAVLVLVVRGRTVDVRVVGGQDAVPLVGVEPLRPFVKVVGEFVVFVAENALPPRREKDLVGHQVPVPKAVLGAADGQFKPFAAAAHLLLGLAPLHFLPGLYFQTQRGGRSVALGRRFRQRAQAGGFESLGHIGPQLAGRCWSVADQFFQYRHGIGARKRRLSRENLVENRAETVDVRAAVDQVEPALGLLGGHVGRRTDDVALDGLRGLRRQTLTFETHPPVFVRVAEHLGHAPVEHQHLAEIAQEDVFPFEVAMNHAARMRIGNRVADRDKRAEQRDQAEGLFFACPPRPMVISRCLNECPPAHEAHAVERRARPRGGDKFIDWHDPRMLELAGDLRLLKKPAAHPAVLEQLRPKRLQCHFPVELLVARPPDLADAALGIEMIHRITRLRRLARRSRRGRPVQPASAAGTRGRSGQRARFGRTL